MIDYSALKTEIALSKYSSYTSVGNDTGLATELNRPDNTKTVKYKSVPFYKVSTWTAGNGVYLKLLGASTVTSSDPNVLAVKNIACVALRLFDSFGALDAFDVTDVSLQTMIGVLVAASVLDNTDATNFDALNNKTPASRAEELFGEGVVVFPDDIVKARGL